MTDYMEHTWIWDPHTFMLYPHARGMLPGWEGKSERTWRSPAFAVGCPFPFTSQVCFGPGITRRAAETHLLPCGWVPEAWRWGLPATGPVTPGHGDRSPAEPQTALQLKGFPPRMYPDPCTGRLEPKVPTLVTGPLFYRWGPSFYRWGSLKRKRKRKFKKKEPSQITHEANRYYISLSMALSAEVPYKVGFLQEVTAPEAVVTSHLSSRH